MLLLARGHSKSASHQAAATRLLVGSVLPAMVECRPTQQKHQNISVDLRLLPFAPSIMHTLQNWAHSDGCVQAQAQDRYQQMADNHSNGIAHVPSLLSQSLCP